MASAVPEPVSAGCGWPLVGSGAIWGPSGPLSFWLIPDEPGYHKSCVISVHPLRIPHCLTFQMTSGRPTWKHVSAADWWMFIARSCGWREALSSGWHNRPTLVPSAWGSDSRIFWFHSKNVRVLHASEGWTLMGGMRVLSLPYKGAPGLEGRAQQNQPNISSLIISTCVKTPQNEVIFFNYSPPPP